ncbi:hypothetical protein CH254_20965 [Rhodococcus sp. 06-412-2C]|nr:hypothetical protein CH254_20965 [Rhodococcus sp. 06-412-2C]OZC98505.1 hypothetical protein CH279_13610 [Rhodococcus sp. 06-412-2B]
MKVYNMIENRASRFNGRPEGWIWWVYDHPLTLILLVVLFMLVGSVVVGPVVAAGLGAAMLRFAASGYGGAT